MYTEDAAESEETRADVAEDEGGEFDAFKGDPKVMFVCAAPVSYTHLTLPTIYSV